ncbi:GNAT family N-acetyltransferase [Erwinia psidii]|uniref:GNAT family N-acetyltransferase n=1 Tax=Erwinia psidii TaxID=69224 RepID=UPI00226B750B|nr:GNAT family N-acetyltransferase [Erwinia psidii]
MYINQIPACFLVNEHFRLIAPALNRSLQMQCALNEFTEMHYEFLLWASGRHSLENVQKNMADAMENFHHDKHEYKFLIIDNDSDSLQGCISLFIRHPEIPHLEIGYWLATGATGRGIMSSACRMITGMASVFFNARRIDIRTAKRNIRNQAVARRCGFRLEAT